MFLLLLLFIYILPIKTSPEPGAEFLSGCNNKANFL